MLGYALPHKQFGQPRQDSSKSESTFHIDDQIFPSKDQIFPSKLIQSPQDSQRLAFWARQNRDPSVSVPATARRQCNGPGL